MTHWSERHAIIPAVYVVLERDGKVLLIRRAGTGYLDGHYTMPAGHLDGNESATTAATREIMEEVGLHIEPSELEMAHCMVYRAAEGDHDRVSFFFRAHNFTGEPRIGEPDKCDDLGWFAYDALPEMVWEAQYALEQMALGKVYSECNF